MAMTFDATLKDLAEDYPADFLALLDQSSTMPWSVLNVDLSTVTSAADFVVGLGDPLQEIGHVDFQASASATKHADLLAYNVILYRHYSVAVHSVIILLRPKAAHGNLSGDVRYAARNSRGRMDFAYEVVRLWEIPSEELLKGGLGTLPLATLGQLPNDVPLESGLAHVIRQMADRLVHEAPIDQTKHLLTSAFLLTGLRVHRDVAKQLFQGVRAMQESDTFLWILDEGEARGLRKVILLQGQIRFGPASESIKAKVEGVKDVAALENLTRRLLDVSSWEELLEGLDS